MTKYNLSVAELIRGSLDEANNALILKSSHKVDHCARKNLVHIIGDMTILFLDKIRLDLSRRLK